MSKAIACVRRIRVRNIHLQLWWDSSMLAISILSSEFFKMGPTGEYAESEYMFEGASNLGDCCLSEMGGLLQMGDGYYGVERHASYWQRPDLGTIYSCWRSEF